MVSVWAWYKTSAIAYSSHNCILCTK